MAKQSYEAFNLLKEEILESFKCTLPENDLDISFEATARAFATFVKNMGAVNREITKDHVFAFFTSTFFNKMNVSSCNPTKLDEICQKLTTLDVA